MAINKKLIHFKSFSDFNSKKLSANEENTQYTLGVDGEVTTGSPEILYQSIVWIKDTKQQWTHGQLYGNKSNHKILWIGTSIPYGDGADNSYPKMVEDALGCTLYNKSIPGSFVSFFPNNEFSSSADVETYKAFGYSLSAKVSEVETKYRTALNNIRSNEGLSNSWVEETIEDFKNASYERIIIPYIDGTIDNCDIVIIDHGFNDRDHIYNTVASFKNDSLDNISYWPADQVGGDTVPYPCTDGNAGWYWLTNASSGMYYDAYAYLNALQSIVDSDRNWTNNYFAMMFYIIRRIWEVNPKIRIVIGNYFSQDSGIDETSVFKTKYILEANNQIAKFVGLQCINPYEITGLRNRTLPNGSTDMITFCPDGVHPGSDTSGSLNRKIANLYIQQLEGLLTYNNI